MNEIIIVVAKYFIIFPPIIALFVLYKLPSKVKRIRLVLLLVISGVIALLLSLLASKLFYNPRPFVVGHFTPLITHKAVNGFPSDHTLLASLIGFVLYTFSKKWGIITLLLAVIIGSARVAAGVHHPIDIIGAFLISLISALLVLSIARLAKRDRA